MSRIGRKPVQIPEGVKVTAEGNNIKVSGVKGELELTAPKELAFEIREGEVVTTKKENTRQAQQLFGLFPRMLSNAIVGTSTGWTKTLVLVGTGYRARLEGKTLVLALGFSHPVKFEPTEDISFTLEENKVIVSGKDKRLVGQFAANIRAVRPPEPYQGKGVKYENEYVRRKAGKSAKTGAKA